MAPTEALSFALPGTLPPLREWSRALIGRDSAMRRLHLAIQKRESHLIWGASGAGKTFLIQQLLAGLSDADRRRCICSPTAKNGRELVTNFLRGLYFAGDPLVRGKVHGD